MVRLGKLGGRKKKEKSKITSKTKGVDETKSTEVLVDGFELEAKLSITKRKLLSLLKQLPNVDIVDYKDGVAVIYVESRNIRKQPYLFSIIYLEKDKIRFLYTIPPKISPKKRRLEVLSYFLNMMSYLGDAYQVPLRELYLLLQEAIREMSEYVSLDYEQMYSMHDALKAQIEQLKREIETLRESNNTLARQNYELKMKLDELQVKYDKLKGLSDEALKNKIMEWISEHNGEIDIMEFSKLYNIHPTRVEEMLNLLVEAGFLEPK